MKSQITRSFVQRFARLSIHVQQQAREAHKLFVSNHQHPSLHFKRICVDPPTYSARVGKGYRVVGGFKGDTVVVLDWYTRRVRSIAQATLAVVCRNGQRLHG